MFFPGVPIQPSLIFRMKVLEPTFSVGNERCCTKVTFYFETNIKKFAYDKRSSLFDPRFSAEEMKFYKIDAKKKFVSL